MKRLILLFLCLLLPALALANPTPSRYQIEVVAEKNLLKGKAQFELLREGLYEFYKGNLKIISIELDSKPLKIISSADTNTFRIFNPQKNSTLEIIFEVNLEASNAIYPQIWEDFLPYPKDAFFWEMTLNVKDEKGLNLFIPYEEKEAINEEKNLYKITKPLFKPPPLIRGSFIHRKLSFTGGELEFLFPKLSSEQEWKEFERYFQKEIVKYPFPEVLFPFKKMFFMPFFEKRSYPLLTLLPLNLKEGYEPILEAQISQTLKYGLNLHQSFLLEGLKTYLTSYVLSPTKREFRKKLLLRDSEEAKAFFYLYEKIENIGEKAFEEFLKNYVQRYLFNGSAEELFIGNLSKLANSSFKADFETFQKVDLITEFEVSPLENENRFFLRVKILQEKSFRPLPLEIVVETEKGEKIKRKLYLYHKENFFDLFFTHKPIRVTLDDEYKIYRSLSFEESPFTWERLFSSKGLIYLAKKEALPLYRDLITNLREKGYSLKFESLELNSLPKENLIFLETLPKNFHLPFPMEGFYFRILPHPQSQDHFLAFIKISSTQDLKKILSKREQLKTAQEFHFKKGEWVFIRQNFAKEGIILEIKEKPKFYGMRPQALKSLENFLPELLPVQVILIGENHDEYSHHLFQLEIIKHFYHLVGPQVVIGLEMVQKPFQKYLDDFILGKISEEELLKKIEYYERWKFDYRLYRNIFLLAKEKKLKLLALDLPQEITKKVFKSGLNNLSEEDKKYLPEMDLNNPSYREFLRKVFLLHNFDNGTNFEYFYQAQLLRDEAMAEEIVNFLKKNPEKKMIVLVGKGHIQDKYGIPWALKKRNFSNFKTIVLGEVEILSPVLADYWFNPSPMEYEKSPTLGVVVEEVQEGLVIREVKKGSLADLLNLKPGDILLMLDKKPLKKIADLKILLTFKRKDSEIYLKIKRKEETLDLKGNLK